MSQTFSLMSSQPSPFPSAKSPAEIDPQKALSALGNSLRWEIFQMLADGSSLHASEVANRFYRDFDGISKHLRILRAAGILKSRRATDKRVEKYYIPAEFRRIPGQIELGFCVLRVPTAKPDQAPEPKPQIRKEAPVIDEFEDEEEEPIECFGAMLVKTASRGSI